MPVDATQAGEDFSAQVIFRTDGEKPQYWRNIWELSTNVGGPFTDWEPFVQSLKNWHLSMLHNAFKLDRIVVSTLAQDSQPYAPENLAVWTFSLQGTRNSNSDPYALNNVLRVDRMTPVGRHGTMFLRGFLQEADVANIGGGAVDLGSVADIQNEIDSKLDTHGLKGYMAASAVNIQLYMIKPGLLNNAERPITGLRAVKMSTKRLKNRKNLAG